MPINFIHNQIQTGAAVVREKLPLPVKLLAASAAVVMLVAFSLAAYRFVPNIPPLFIGESPSVSGDDDAILVSADGSKVLIDLLPEEMQEALKQNPTCPLELAQCSDGTLVGRVGPNCEFALCSSEIKPESAEEILTKFAPIENLTPHSTILPPMTEEEYYQWIVETEIRDEIRSQ